MKSIKIHLNIVKGFTLVELMVSIVISSIIMLGVVSLYSTSRKGQKTNESIARIQENLRFSADMISRDIRMAGYTGCRSSSVTNALSNIDDLPYKFENHISGFEAGDTFPAQFPAVGTNPGDRVAGTDAVAVIRVSATGFKITGHNSVSAKISFDAAGAGIELNDILAVTDCSHSAIFQVSGPTNPNDFVVHNTGVGTPGNCWKGLGPVGDPRPACTAIGSTITYGDNARIHKYIMHGYFIGVSTSGQTKSLYIINLDKGATTKTELVEGVEDFQLTYGVDSDDDGFPERFIKANAAGMDFKQIVAVKLGMLIASINDVKTTAPTTAKSYTLSDTTVTPAADKKLRFAYNTTVKIRNKGIR